MAFEKLFGEFAETRGRPTFREPAAAETEHAEIIQAKTRESLISKYARLEEKSAAESAACRVSLPRRRRALDFVRPCAARVGAIRLRVKPFGSAFADEFASKADSLRGA